MTERWVSQAKHYCKYCKKWMADSPVVRRHHEQGRGHQQAVQDATRAARQAKDDQRREAKELAAALRDAEAAARDAFARDTAVLGGSAWAGAQGAPVVKRDPPRGPVAGSAGGAAAGGARSSAPFGDADSRPPPPPPPTTHVLGSPDERAGEYRVRGVLYLQGDFHADKLVAGTPCEALHVTPTLDGTEGDEEWLPAEVVAVKQVVVPNTTIVQRSYSVRYLASTETPTTIAGEVIVVKPDRLRLRVTPAPTQPTAATIVGGSDADMEGEVSAESNSGQQPEPTDADEVGLGGWTVTRTTTLEQRAEEEAAAKIEISRREDSEMLLEARRIGGVDEDDDAEFATDAYGAANPYGGAHRGVELDDADAGSTAIVDQGRIEATDSASNTSSAAVSAPPVAFKRRAATNKAHLRRKKRRS